MAAASEGDNAILSKKPLGGWSCASCEKHLTNVQQQQVPEHQSWNRMPYRDPNDRIAKVGQGFSKMLQMLKPSDVGQSRLTQEADSQINMQSPQEGRQQQQQF